MQIKVGASYGFMFSWEFSLLANFHSVSVCIRGARIRAIFDLSRTLLCTQVKWLATRQSILPRGKGRTKKGFSYLLPQEKNYWDTSQVMVEYFLKRKAKLSMGLASLKAWLFISIKTLPYLAGIQRFFFLIVFARRTLNPTCSLLLPVRIGSNMFCCVLEECLYRLSVRFCLWTETKHDKMESSWYHMTAFQRAAGNIVKLLWPPQHAHTSFVLLYYEFCSD